MIRTVLVLLSTARRLRLGACTPLGSGGEAQLMRWARSLQVITCSGRNGSVQAPDDGIWRARGRIGEAHEVCWRASGAAIGPKAQPADGLGLGHGHVGQVIGAEMLCECAGVARWSTAAAAVASAAGGPGLMRLPCGRVWTA